MKLPFELQNDENVLLLKRRHPVYLISRLVGIVLAALLPVAALLWLSAVTFGLDGTGGMIVWAIAAVWVIFWAIRGYFTWFRYQNDLWVITDQRIVDSIRRHWFHHQMASADLVDVEDINVVKEGLLATAFNFGDVRCQTAGTESNFVLAGVPEPTKALATVDAARDAARKQLSRPAY